MKWIRVGMISLIGMASLTGVAFANAESGFGLYGGLATHSSKGQFTETPLTGIEFEFSSQGLSYGIDYQFALADNFSISPFLMSSFEEFKEESTLFSSGGTEATNGRHDILGLQLRFWIENLFIGGHAGVYTEIINFDFSSGGGNDAGFVGTGGGLIVGWESDSGLFFSGQVDVAKLKGGDENSTDIESETDLTGARVHVGYRWK